MEKMLEELMKAVIPKRFRTKVCSAYSRLFHGHQAGIEKTAQIAHTLDGAYGPRTTPRDLTRQRPWLATQTRGFNSAHMLLVASLHARLLRAATQKWVYCTTIRSCRAQGVSFFAQGETGSPCRTDRFSVFTSFTCLVQQRSRVSLQ